MDLPKHPIDTHGWPLHDDMMVGKQNAAIFPEPVCV